MTESSDQIRSNESPAEKHERIVEAIYQSALAEHSEFQQIPSEDLRGTIDAALKELEALEVAADRENALSALTPEVAKKIAAIWDFSGSGTYDDPVATEDAYKHIPWAQGSDRARLNYSVFLIRKISEMLDSNSRSTRLDEIKAGILRTKESINNFGPTLMYNGTDQMNAVARDVLTRDGIVMPEEKVHIAGKGILRTTDQIQTFLLPENLNQPGKEIGIVSHGPHLVRIAHMLNRYKPLPADMQVRFFPVPFPKAHWEECAMQEVRGLLYYIYLSKDRDATVEPYPYTIHGKKESQG